MNQSLSFHICVLKLLKMFHPVLLCLCLWRLVGATGVEFVPVFMGDSVSLNSDLTKMKDDDVIQWWFENKNTVIAEINVTADRIAVYDDVHVGTFRDRLKLDSQTGSLTITNTTTEHEGYYKLLINGVRKNFYLTFIVEISVTEGDSVTLNSEVNDDVILWKFGTENTLIAEINETAKRIAVYDDVLDGRFRDRLKLDKQTGSLTITNTRTEHAGHYKRLTGPAPFITPLLNIFSVSFYAHLPVPVISSNSSRTAVLILVDVSADISVY
ncbi:uncharacterized protein LOC125262596 [Megalobrama amblycephala]|uniref:uncharacterized protein LOC125262596 n=1 Tax=Megalobrama amblycephala TaxID=75352 RepID=UPI002013D14C|nr:uncharacterized protein LOC125262596 [Megalobrama amblycephala]